MTVTRASAAAKGKAREVSPRAVANRAAAARASVERVAAERVTAAQALSVGGQVPYQENSTSRSAFTLIPNGSQHEVVTLAARAVDGGTYLIQSMYITYPNLHASAPPIVTRKRKTVTEVTEVLYGEEAAAAISAISSANAPQVADNDAMVICRPTTPDPPASLTDLEGVARFTRSQAARQFVTVTREEMEAQIARELADEELAAKLQASEWARANVQHGAGASTSRATFASTPDPAGTPMDITPSPAPIPRHAAPPSPSPLAGSGSRLALGQSGRHLTAANGMSVAAASAPSAGLFTTQGLATGAPSESAPVMGPPSPPSYSVTTGPANGQGRDAGPSSTSIRGRMSAAGSLRPPTHSSTSASGSRQGGTPGPGPASTSRRAAAAGPSRPPAYSENAPGTSYFILPIRPSARNGFVAGHEVVRTSTEIIDGTPYITINDDAADDTEEERGAGFEE